MTATSAIRVSGPEQTRGRIGVSRLQLEMRMLFRSMSQHAATLKSLGLVGDYLGASYAAIHMRLASRVVSEEYLRDEVIAGDELRKVTNQAMLDVMATGLARCVRLGTDHGCAVAILAAVLYDSSLAQVGAGVMVVGPADRAETVEKLSLFEGLMGFMSLLAAEEVREASAGSRPGPKQDTDLARVATKVADHPIHLAFHIVAGLQSRHGLNQVAIGYVQRDATTIKIAAVSGFDELSHANPGLKLVKAAMEECLDRREIVLYHGSLLPKDAAVEDDCRLHAQWSRTLDGDTVASFPILLGKETVAVVSVCCDPKAGLQRKNLAGFAEDLSQFAPLIPLSRLASRGVLAHALDVAANQLRRVVEPGGMRRGLLLALMLTVCAWVAFGSVPYNLTVSGVVTAGDLRFVSSPREGILLELSVLPGAQVREGDVLAALDDHEDQMRKVQLEATIVGLDAESDKSLADGLAGNVRVLAARKGAASAELDLVKLRISQARIRAPITGMVLEGDLRKRVGSRLPMGEQLFQLSGSDHVMVELQIPEKRLELDLGQGKAVFATTVRPHERIELGPIRLSPVSRIVRGNNVFVAECVAIASPVHLLPGMEGVANVELGWRSAWWVLTHRVTNWMRLRFWI